MSNPDTSGDAPGLEWRARRNGSAVPYWIARRDYVQAGYPDKTVNLRSLAHDPVALAARCQVLQSQMLLWGAGIDRNRRYDGTIAGLFRLYQSHEDSPYHEKRQATRAFYDDGAKVVVADIGGEQIAGLTGLDIRRRFKVWKEPAKAGGPERARRAKKCIQALGVALAFGQAMKLTGCMDLRDSILGFEWPNPKRRKVAMTYAQASGFIEKALARGDVPHALAQALMFECTLRQKDVIGEWQQDTAAEGGIMFDGRRWDYGLVWGTHINRDLILTKETSKTGTEVVFDLKTCPLVMLVLQHVPVEERIGPVIMHTAAGRPYLARYYAAVWRDIATAAGIPAGVWNMDSRAGGITEGRASGASLEDLRHHAGHSNIGTTAGYDRATPGTAAKVMSLRVAKRNENSV